MTKQSYHLAATERSLETLEAVLPALRVLMRLFDFLADQGELAAQGQVRKTGQPTIDEIINLARAVKEKIMLQYFYPRRPGSAGEPLMSD